MTYTFELVGEDCCTYTVRHPFDAGCGHISKKLVKELGGYIDQITDTQFLIIPSGD